MSKFKILLNLYKKVGIYHIIMAVVTHISMIMSFYVVLSLSNEKQLPSFYCADRSNSETKSEYSKCSHSDYCSGKFMTYIDYENSIDNWTTRHELYCDRQNIYDYITSSIFFCAIFSSLIMSVITDKLGRKFSFQLECFGNLVGYLLLYYENSVFTIFMGVILNEICSHLFNTSMIYIYEFFSFDAYIYLITAQNINYGIIGLIASLYIKFYRETRLPLLIMVFFSAVSSLYSALLLTESPDWLIHLYQHEKETEKKQIYLNQLEENYQYMCKINFPKEDIREKLAIFDKVLMNMENLLTDEEKLNLSNELKEDPYTKLEIDEDEESYKKIMNRKFYKHFFLAVYLWIVNQILFYSTLTNLSAFEEKIPFSTVCYFLTHILANINVAISSSWMGIKHSIKYFCLILTALEVTLFFTTESKDLYILLPTFCLFNFLSTSLGETIYLYIPDLFEANIRSSACSYSKIPSKLLLVLSPFILGNNLYVMYTIFAFLTATAPVIIYMCL